jgi:hypothetical protein
MEEKLNRAEKSDNVNSIVLKKWGIPEITLIGKDDINYSGKKTGYLSYELESTSGGGGPSYTS